MWPTRTISLDELKKLYDKGVCSEEDARVHLEVSEFAPAVKPIRKEILFRRFVTEERPYYGEVVGE